MLKKYLYILMAMLTIMSVSGCQLAKEDNATELEDEFIGILVTYVEDGADYKVLGDEEGRLYAKLAEYIDENGYKAHEYVFEVENSMPLFTPKFTTSDADGEFEYISTMMSDKMHNIDVSNNINYIDDENSHVTNSHQADIYFKSDVIMYVYNVYQKEDGSVYAINENMGTHISGNGFTKEEYTKSGKDTTAICKLNTCIKEEPKSVDIICMNNNDEIVKCDSYDISDIPKDYKLDDNVQYIIVKTTDIKNNIETKIYTSEDMFLDLVTVDDTVVLGKTSVELEWSDNGN